MKKTIEKIIHWITYFINKDYRNKIKKEIADTKYEKEQINKGGK